MTEYVISALDMPVSGVSVPKKGGKVRLNPSNPPAWLRPWTHSLRRWPVIETLKHWVIVPFFSDCCIMLVTLLTSRRQKHQMTRYIGPRLM